MQTSFCSLSMERSPLKHFISTSLTHPQLSLKHSLPLNLRKSHHNHNPNQIPNSLFIPCSSTFPGYITAFVISIEEHCEVLLSHGSISVFSLPSFSLRQKVLQRSQQKYWFRLYVLFRRLSPVVLYSVGLMRACVCMCVRVCVHVRVCDWYLCVQI